MIMKCRPAVFPDTLDMVRGPEAITAQ